MKRFPAWLLVLLVLAACGREVSVEQQIIATLRTMEYAAEEGDHFEFMGYIADTFKRQQGSMDRRGFHRFMIFQINQHRRLQAQFFPIYVQETGEDSATASFRILVTGGGGLLPERGQVFEVETGWIRPDGDWLLDAADWKPVSLVDVNLDELVR
jgi:hypothetical protein